MLGSLYFSEVKAYVPCDLCWYQRILMYPLTVMLAIGITVRDKWIPRLVLPLSVMGMGVSGYHFLLEKTDIFPKDTFCRAGASCVTVWINWFGFITIPFLALTAFTIITIMCVVAILAGEPRQTDEVYGVADDDDDQDGELSVTVEESDALDPALEQAWPRQPWILVTAIIAVIVLYFGVIFTQGWADRARAEELVAAAESPLVLSTVLGDMSTSADSASAGEADAATIAAGRSTFALYCSSCHGANAEGVAALGPSLAPANQFILGHSDAEVIAMIQEGRPVDSPDNTTGVAMLPNAGVPNLTESDLQAIIAYLRSID